MATAKQTAEMILHLAIQDWLQAIGGETFGEYRDRLLLVMSEIEADVAKKRAAKAAEQGGRRDHANT